MHAFCYRDENCGTETVDVDGEPNECYVFDSHQFASSAAFFQTFPVLTLSLEGVFVHWEPQNYLFAWPETPTTYCVGVYDSGDYGNVLGGLFLRGQEVVFDRELKMIGLMPSISALEL